MNNTENLEAEVMKLLLDGNDPVLAVLREQYAKVSTTRREHTGAGAYTYFVLDDGATVLDGSPSFSFGDVIAEVDGLDIGGGFLLYIQEGRLHMLETFAYDDSWPTEITGYRVKYQSESGRDVATLRQTPGWPNDS